MARPVLTEDTMRLRKLALLIAAGYAMQCAIASLARAGSAAQRSKSRHAGRRKLKVRSKDWDMVDERADQSFPASDPPGTY